MARPLGLGSLPVAKNLCPVKSSHPPSCKILRKTEPDSPARVFAPRTNVMELMGMCGYTPLVGGHPLLLLCPFI